MGTETALGEAWEQEDGSESKVCHASMKVWVRAPAPMQASCLIVTPAPVQASCIIVIPALGRKRHGHPWAPWPAMLAFSASSRPIKDPHSRHKVELCFPHAYHTHMYTLSPPPSHTHIQTTGAYILREDKAPERGRLVKPAFFQSKQHDMSLHDDNKNSPPSGSELTPRGP